MLNKLIGKVLSILELDILMESLFKDIDRMSEFINEINNIWNYGECKVEFELLDNDIDYDTQLRILNIEIL